MIGLLVGALIGAIALAAGLGALAFWAVRKGSSRADDLIKLTGDRADDKFDRKVAQDSLEKATHTYETIHRDDADTIRRQKAQLESAREDLKDARANAQRLIKAAMEGGKADPADLIAALDDEWMRLAEHLSPRQPPDRGGGAGSVSGEIPGAGGAARSGQGGVS
jgi:gas vesicle protein